VSPTPKAGTDIGPTPAKGSIPMRLKRKVVLAPDAQDAVPKNERLKRLCRFFVGCLVAIGIAVPIATASVSVSVSMAGATSSSLTLTSPWTAAPFGTNSPSVSETAGVVSFRGAIAAPSNNFSSEIFVLPAAYRPAEAVDLPIDLCGSTHGRLFVEQNGAVFVAQNDGSLSDADCFTSLDGASFVQSSPGTPLTLIDGWSGAAGTATPAAALVNGVVHFQGAITASSPSSPETFVLPANLTPGVTVFIPVDMCNSTNGRLEIATNGDVSVREEDQGTTFEDCFTSLDGASFVLHPKNSTALTLKNGWDSRASGTAPAAAELVKGVVRLQGGISGGTTSVITTLPLGLRPTKNVFVKVDLCTASMDGRLLVKPTGKVSVQETDGGLGTAQCLTSLDGASFVK
jgi:hypothetical protein